MKILLYEFTGDYLIDLFDEEGETVCYLLFFGWEELVAFY
jgi:hypothetical protein